MEVAEIADGTVTLAAMARERDTAPKFVLKVPTLRLIQLELVWVPEEPVLKVLCGK